MPERTLRFVENETSRPRSPTRLPTRRARAARPAPGRRGGDGIRMDGRVALALSFESGVPALGAAGRTFVEPDCAGRTTTVFFTTFLTTFLVGRRSSTMRASLSQQRSTVRRSHTVDQPPRHR